MTGFNELMAKVRQISRFVEDNDDALNSEEYNWLGEALLSGDLDKCKEAVNDFLKAYSV